MIKRSKNVTDTGIDNKSMHLGFWAYFIVYNTNGSDASPNNLQGLHQKTNNLYENYNC